MKEIKMSYEEYERMVRVIEAHEKTIKDLLANSVVFMSEYTTCGREVKLVHGIESLDEAIGIALRDNGKLINELKKKLYLVEMELEKNKPWWKRL